MKRSLTYSEITDVDLDAMITDIVDGNDQLGSEAVRPVTGRWNSCTKTQSTQELVSN